MFPWNNQLIETLVRTTCPACDSESFVSVGQKNGFALQECCRCQLHFSDPMRAATQGWYEQSDVYNRTPHRVLHWNFAEALKLPGQYVFDVGCGKGEFLYWAQKDGRKVAGADFNRASIESARKEFGIQDLHVGDVAQLQLDRAYDLVTMFEVLEHLPDPVSAAAAVKRLVKKDGLFVVSVPSYQRWPRLFDDQIDSPPHHLTLWTPEALTACLSRAGFKLKKIRVKPLQAADLGSHMKMRLKRLLGRNGKSSGPRSYNAMTSANGIAAAALAPLCWTMRMYPPAGGYTLLAISQPA